MIPLNQNFRYIPEERMISQREKDHIERILTHPIETDEDYAALGELANDQSTGVPVEDHGLEA